MYRNLLHPIESFRTSPVQFVCIGLGLYTAVANIHVTLEANNPLLWGFMIANVGCTALNAGFAKSKFDLRDRLESRLEKNGFDDRLLDKTTQAYCTRQAARIACENTGYSEEYAALCKANSENALFTWLPHI